MNLYRILMLIVILIVSGIVTYEDIKEQKILTVVIFSGILISFFVNVIIGEKSIISVLLSAAFYGLFYFLIKIAVKGKFGNGDIYFGIFQGMCLPFKFLPLCVLAEVLLALLIMNRRIGKEKFPFIPFMSGALFLLYILELII